jgi:hypothetical protein
MPAKWARSRCRSVVALSVVLAFGAAAHIPQAFGNAADSSESSGLDEIVVTATRRVERLQDVPISATAFSQEKLDAQGLHNIDDLTRLTPGVTFQRDATTSSGNFNDEDSDINIRGVDSWPSLSDPQASNFENGNAQRNPSTDPFYLAAVKLDWDAGFAHLTSNTSYFSRNQHSISDYTQFDRALFGLPVLPSVGDLGTSHDTDMQKNFYQEVRLQSIDTSATVEWTAGLFYDHTIRPRTIGITATYRR